jgi:hypothetical protein
VDREEVRLRMKLDSRDFYREAGRWSFTAGAVSLVAGWAFGFPTLIIIGAVFLALGGVLVFERGESVPRALTRRRSTLPEAQPFRQPAKVEYIDGRPAWPVGVVHPSRFRGADYDVQFCLFRLPQGSLIACLLRLYDIPESPYFLHRVFDVSFPPVREYLHALVDAGEWMLVLESKGSEATVTRRLKVEQEGLAKLLAQGEAFNSRLPRVEGAKALEQFLALFEPEAEKGGCEAGWRAVDRWVDSMRRG